MTEWEGVFPLWKEAGMTSHDCVSKARRLFQMKRVGHTGTLDPDVSGVLPLCLGRATRIVEYLQELPKIYEAEMTIGYATDTEDASGAVTEQAEAVHVSEERIREAVASCVGEIEQTPPMYSAVKIDGRRLYDLAREGITVERNSRKITIHRIDIQEIHLDRKYPTVRMTVVCSKGTYIRTLCTDIGRALGYPAVMSALIRTGSGPIRREQCVTFGAAEELKAEGKLGDKVLSISEALSFMPRGEVSPDAVRVAEQGRKLYARAVRVDSADGTIPERDDALCRLYGGEDRLLGIYRFDSSVELYVPVKLFT